MKEFEKRENEICLKIEGCSEESCTLCESGQKVGWRTALRWVNNMFNTNVISGSPPYNISEEIEKELRS